MAVTVDNYLLCCRMCLKLEKNELFLNIFSAKLEKSETTLQLALEKTTGIKCSIDDELPAQICQSCQLRLQDAHNFMLQSYVNHNLLKTLKIAAALQRSAFEQSPEQSTPIKVDPGEKNDVVTVTLDKGESFRVEYLDDEDSEHESIGEDHYDDSKGQSDFENDPEELRLEQDSEGSSSQIVFDEPTDAVDFILQNFKDLSKQQSPKKAKKPPANVFQRHECEVCRKTFQRKSNLVDHLRLHANVKLFSCNYCDAAFVQSGNLKSHIRTHTLEKPFSCSSCGKKFSQSSALKTHMRSHTNTRDYICDVCNKGFTNKSDLTKHKITHSDIRYYQCVRCTGRYFAQKVHLKKHLKSHHSDEDAADLLKLGTLKEGVRLGELKPPSSGSIFIRTRYTPNE
uniref:Putative c2h2-type zn-finger protein n=1 Tax=Culex tarsalis TaxID=7177 RepID=A0A1Q3F210_CULTA